MTLHRTLLKGAAIVNRVTTVKKSFSGWNPIKQVVNHVASDRDASAAILMEIIGTMILVVVVLVSYRRSNRPSSSWCSPRVTGALLIGLTLTFLHSFLFLVVGDCGINPARSFGTAAIAGKWQDHWVFWLGPLLGGALGGLLVRFVLRDQAKESHKQEEENVEMLVVP